MRHWYTRYRISSALDDGVPAASRAGGHLGRCPACQAYARELESLHARLALGAPSAPAPRRAAARRPGRPLLIAAPLALAAAVSIALAVGTGGKGEPPPPGIPVVRVQELTDRVLSVLARGDAPLDAELEDLIHDGRRGLDTVFARSGLRQ